MGWVGGRVKHDQHQSATACSGGQQQQCMSGSPYYQYVNLRTAVRSTCSYSSYSYSYSYYSYYSFPYYYHSWLLVYL